MNHTQHSPEIGNFLGHKTPKIHLQWHFSKPQTYHFQQFQTLQSTRKGVNIFFKGLAVHSLTVHPFLFHSRILFSRYISEIVQRLPHLTPCIFTVSVVHFCIYIEKLRHTEHSVFRFVNFHNGQDFTICVK